MKSLVVFACLIVASCVLFAVASAAVADAQKSRNVIDNLPLAAIDMDAIKDAMKKHKVSKEDLAGSLKDYLKYDDAGRKDLEAMKERLSQIRAASPEKREELLRARNARPADAATRSELLKQKIEEIKRMKEARAKVEVIQDDSKKEL